MTVMTRTTITTIVKLKFFFILLFFISLQNKSNNAKYLRDEGKETKK
jgi:hypothetical protein